MTATPAADAATAGARLRAARVAAGLTQEELADRLGVTQSQISRIEAGEATGGVVAGILGLALRGTIDPRILWPELWAADTPPPEPTVGRFAAAAILGWTPELLRHRAAALGLGRPGPGGRRRFSLADLRALAADRDGK